MFGNIGGKIKVFVIVVTILEIIGFILAGGALIALSIFGETLTDGMISLGFGEIAVYIPHTSSGIAGIVGGIVLMVLGSFAAWIFSFIPYGLGQLIQNTDKLVRSVENVKNITAKIAVQANAPAANSQQSAPAYSSNGNSYRQQYGGGYEQQGGNYADGFRQQNVNSNFQNGNGAQYDRNANGLNGTNENSLSDAYNSKKDSTDVSEFSEDESTVRTKPDSVADVDVEAAGDGKQSAESESAKKVADAKALADEIFGDNG